MVYKETGGYQVVAMDATGQHRPDWEDAVRQRPLRARRMPEAFASSINWQSIVERMKVHLDPGRHPCVVAAVLVTLR